VCGQNFREHSYTVVIIKFFINERMRLYKFQKGLWLSGDHFLGAKLCYGRNREVGWGRWGEEGGSRQPKYNHHRPIQHI
jgi:hypothetical protein